MIKEDREKWGTLLEKWTPIFINACTLIGVLLATILLYIFHDELYIEVVIGGFIGTLIPTIVYVIKRRRKKNNIPEFDERTI